MQVDQNCPKSNIKPEEFEEIRQEATRARRFLNLALSVGQNLFRV